MRRVLASLCAAVSLTAVVAVAPAGAEPTGAACTLTGTATFAPGLGVAAGVVQYTLEGELSDCQSSDGVAGGSVTAAGTGRLGCGGGDSTGTAEIVWDDDATTTAGFLTTGAATTAVVSGGATAGRYENSRVAGAIAFTLEDPSACTLPGGAGSAGVQGVVAIGDPGA